MTARRDILEHLRTVHLSLVLICFAFLAASSIEPPDEMGKAIAELNLVQNLETQLQSSFPESNDALGNSVGDQWLHQQAERFIKENQIPPDVEFRVAINYL